VRLFPLKNNIGMLKHRIVRILHPQFLPVPSIFCVVGTLCLFVSSVLAQTDFIHPELTWYTIETRHFYVDYHDGEERTAQLVAKIAEEMYGPVTSLYHYEPTQKVSFVIWDNDDYSNGETYFFDNKINIWASNLDFALRGTHNWLRNVVTHEFTHDVQMQTAMKFSRQLPAIYLQWLGYEAERRPDVLYGYPNVVVSYPLSGIVVPAWFAEGVAQYNAPDMPFRHDTWDSHRDMILRMYVLNNKMLSLEEMGGFGKTSLGNESTYNSGFAFVSYLAGEYGPDVLRKLSDAMSSITDVSIDHAFKKVLNKSGDEVYDEWKAFLENSYGTRTEKIKETLHQGKIIRDVGFANFYPVFSPDGSKIAYCSNKSFDYFGTSSIYVYNLADSIEKKISYGVASELSWSPDGRYLLYSKLTRDNNHWDDLNDLYTYDLQTEKEVRLTDGLRAQYASLSNDGKKVAFVASDDKALDMLCASVNLLDGTLIGGTDGTMNLYSADIDLQHNSLSNIRRLTNFINGQQIYVTHWSEDNSKIVFDYSINSSRRIGVYAFADSSIKFVTPRGEDSRDAAFADHDSCVVFSSDRSGIFNIYKQNLHTDSTVALTNVLGGAFMPALSQNGTLVYSSYQWNGYKIASIDKAQPVQQPPEYKPQIAPIPQVAGSADAPVSMVQAQKNEIPDYKSVPYKNTTTSLSFYPVLLFDNYNPHVSSLDEIKAGLYFSSADVIDKYDIFGGITINKLLERDIFFQFDYNDKIPLLSSLGIYPAFTLSVYNISRQTQGNIGLGADTIYAIPVKYNLVEIDAAFGGPILNPSLYFTFGFTFDNYGVTQSGFQFPVGTGPYYSSLGYTYFIGRTFYSQLEFDGIAPARNSWINPLGIRSRLRVSAALDKLNNGEFEAGTSLVIPIYTKYNFIQADFMNYFAVPLLRDDDALAAKLHVGYTFGAEINNFFDFYAGGLIGMRGYPFYAIGGNKLLTMNLTYRYPLFRDINKQILQFYLSDIYLSAFGDAGNCWNGSINGTKFKKDIGGELRMSGFSFYSFPTALFFDAAYGLDKFTTQLRDFQTSVTYGKEWRFYFGLTFSFDIIDFGRQGFRGMQ
jgi:Tol biopolymer transport system component